MARRNKGEERRIARERMARLIDLADEAVATHPPRAHRYADLAWRVKTRYQIRGTGVEWRICRACHAFLRPGVTARVRLRDGVRIVTCLRCGHVRRRPLATSRHHS